jgi:DNA-binding NtrC family response regulator
VLLVDGEPAVHRLVVRVFTSEAMDVVCVEDVEKAIAAIREGGIDVVLTSGHRRYGGPNDPYAAIRTGFPDLPILSLETLDGPPSTRLRDGLSVRRSFSVERLVAAVRRSLHQTKSA